MARSVGAPSLLLRTLKNTLLPMGPRMRRLPLGIARGLALEIDFRHHSKLYLGLYEVELNRHLRRLCYRGARCFDVGGHIGYDALILARLSGGDVFTFEADERLCAVIQRAVDANRHYGEKIKIVRAFVAESSDEATNQVSLDAFVRPGDVGLPDLIKIDVEGAEALVLRGAEQILCERRPNLIIETHGSQVEEECLQLLHAHGYTPQTVDPRRLAADHRPEKHNRWLVCRGRA